MYGSLTYDHALSLQGFSDYTAQRSAALALDRPFAGLHRSMATPQCSSPALDVPRALVAPFPPPPVPAPAAEEAARSHSRAFQWEGEGVDVNSLQGHVEIMLCLWLASTRK